jgi:hypothetical protein
MKTIKILLILLVLGYFKTYSQDTLIVNYDSNKGNYKILYGQKESLIEVRFWPANKLQPIVHAVVARSSDTLHYSYLLTNSKTSEQRIADFLLFHKCKVFAVERPNKEWLSEDVGLHSCWEWSHTKQTKRQVGSKIYHTCGIFQDSSQGGFKVSSFGIPTIVPSYFQGDVGLTSFNEEPGLDVEDTLRYFESFPRNYAQVNTIGPTDPPNPFLPLNFLDTLRSYIRQSHTLGWINNTRDDDCEEDENADDGIVRNLDKRLEKIRDFISKKKYDKAQQQLEKFLGKVEKLWKRNKKEEEKNKKNPKIIFTSEAYALLKYNGEYLSQQLPGKK